MEQKQVETMTTAHVKHGVGWPGQFWLHKVKCALAEEENRFSDGSESVHSKLVAQWTKKVEENAPYVTKLEEQVKLAKHMLFDVKERERAALTEQMTQWQNEIYMLRKPSAMLRASLFI